MFTRTAFLFLLSTVKFFFSPAAGLAWKFSPLETILITSAGGICGFLFFFYLWQWVSLKWKLWKKSKSPDVNTKFSFRNRTIIRIKNSFGLVGIAFATPVLISVPVGAIVAARFFSHKRWTIIIMCSGIVFWSINLTLLLHYFSKS